MRNPTPGAYLLLAIAATSSGCTSQPVYAPPKHSAEGAQCPFGRVLVCRDRYDAAVAGEEDEEQEFCMCQDLTKVR